MNVLDSVIKGKSISKALSDAGSNLVNKGFRNNSNKPWDVR